MRRFTLVRHADVSGVSGTGVVAEGVEFAHGWVALCWVSRLTSMTFFWSVADVERIHGHEGMTEIVWLDEAA